MPRINLSHDDLRDLRASAEKGIDDILEARHEEPNNKVYTLLSEKRELIHRVDRLLAQELTP